MDHDDVIDALNDLIDTSKDGEYSFRACAEHMRNADTKQLFMRCAEECRAAATQLQALVVQLGGSAEDSGTVAGAAHRGWAAVKGTLAGYADKAILKKPNAAKTRRHRAARDEELPPDVRAVVERQYEGLKRNHAQVRVARPGASGAPISIRRFD